ncbi:M23 family metallopeptidase [Devosia sp.]|uniref:M23 family metallopeptidase n=1 Tax=Devosia sp. TaxID=1871048 RepID=UPI003F6ECFC2
MQSIDEALKRRRYGAADPANPLRRALHRAGYEDSPPLTLNAVDGEHPRGRELSLAWLAGTVMTGITSVLLMGAALYVAFDGRESFSTASQALMFQRSGPAVLPTGTGKGDRIRPVAATRSEFEVVEASIRTVEDGRTMLRSQAFTRLDATLATGETALAADIPAFDPSAIATSEPAAPSGAAPAEIYTASVEGEVAITMAALPAQLLPASAITDRQAADLVKASLQDAYFEDAGERSLAYAAAPLSLPAATLGVAENVTVMSKTRLAGAGGGRSERIVTAKQATPLRALLLKNGFTEQSYAMVATTLRNVLPSLELPAGAKLRILMGPSRMSATPVPYRLSIYVHDPSTRAIRHAATAAMTDRGTYVIGQAPGMIELPEEDIEAADVGALPSLYRSIWETARKHDLDDATTAEIVAMFAYEVDLTQRVQPGDTLQLLATRPESGTPELVYASLRTGGTSRELFRFRTADGSVDYYSPDGETGKRFLTRRPLQGGGRLASRYGYRIHPIFKTRRLHSGVDLASPLGTPVYAGGDGIIKRAQWLSGYGRYVELDHVNGYQTAYAHMSRIADGLKPGMRVRQGQIVGYVGSTGNSTGNHLHYEIRVNGRTVDPLSVKLPRDKELPAQSAGDFTQAVGQVRQLMQRRPGEEPS